MLTTRNRRRGYRWQVPAFGPIVLELTGFCGIVRGRWTGLNLVAHTPEIFFDGFEGVYKARKWMD